MSAGLAGYLAITQLAQHLDMTLPDDIAAGEDVTLGVRSVRPDGRSSHDPLFRWPWPGNWTPRVVADTSAAECSYGLHVALGWRGLSAMGPVHVCQVVAYRESDVAHRGVTKLRVSQAAVLDMWDVHRLARDTNLSNANLSGADLSGANLFGADLRYANLRHAVLHSANLTCATLRYANLTGAKMYCANLRHANLHSANLHCANLRYTNLTGADLTGAKMHGASLRYANLTGADLHSADLTGADLSDAVLHGDDLRYTNLTGADLSGADLSGADLSGAVLSGANLRYTNLTDADLSGANHDSRTNPASSLPAFPATFHAYRRTRTALSERRDVPCRVGDT